MRDANLNLIPADYVLERRAHRIVRITIIGFLTVGVLIGALRFALDQQIAELRTETTRLQTQHNQQLAQRTVFEELVARRDGLQRKVDILDGLRGGLRADRVFHLVDEAVNADTWFRKWSFRRRGELTETKPETVHAGYLIIVAEPDQSTGKLAQAWRLDTHMEIAGSALDHSALARFVEHLLAQTAVADVRILRTGSRPGKQREIVDFDLAITLRNELSA